MTKNSFAPDDLILVVEVISNDTEENDRETKLEIYARHRIQHYWIVENEGNLPVVHVYELDHTIRFYRHTGIYRERLTSTTPFEIDIDLTGLDRI
ncbi:hypothetical protein Kisp02_09920 [Kineosporia sp. NBRC 101731]|nr:hypothetical protein Kisp02_09920 [Kineosporia sp. NBRC 101731]